MTDQALQNAISRREELAKQVNEAQQRIEEWRKELRRVETFISDWHAFAGVAPLPQRDAAVVTVPKPAKPANSKKEDVAAEARKIIEEWGRPIRRTDLYENLVERGYVMDGADPEMVLSTMLWRAGAAAGVVRLRKGGGYWLKEQPWGPTGYDPADEDLMQLTDNRDPEEAESGRLEAEASIHETIKGTL